MGRRGGDTAIATIEAEDQLVSRAFRGPSTVAALILAKHCFCAEAEVTRLRRNDAEDVVSSLMSPLEEPDRG